MTIRIAIVDDHPVVLAGLCTFLADQTGFEVVAQDSQLNDPCVLLDKQPNVAVLDVRMAGMSPVLVRSLVQAGVRVLLFTRSARSANVDILIEAGAQGVVSKEEDLQVLVEAIAKLARGETHIPEREGLAPHLGLSGRERAVFDALIASKRAKEIAFELNLSLSTVYTYAERIRKKLGVADVGAIVAYAHREGLLSDL